MKPVPPVRTFIDSGLLIVAATGRKECSERAMQILDDPDREFVTSDFVQLEVLPKAVYHKRSDEADFYREFLSAAVTNMIRSSHALVTDAEDYAERSGLDAVDALHVAAAFSSGCDQLVTTEKNTRPFFRVTGLSIVSIADGR